MAKPKRVLRPSPLSTAWRRPSTPFHASVGGSSYCFPSFPLSSSRVIYSPPVRREGPRHERHRPSRISAHQQRRDPSRKRDAGLRVGRRRGYPFTSHPAVFYGVNSPIYPELLKFSLIYPKLLFSSHLSHTFSSFLNLSQLLT